MHPRLQGKLLRAVTIELPEADLHTFDSAAMISRVRELGANMAVSFALGYLFGESYYPSAIAPPHPDLGGRDLLGELLAESRRQGLLAIAYVNTQFAGEHIFAAHSDWVQRRRDGELTRQGAAVAICPNSPYVETLCRVVEEVATRFSPDGFFFDEPSMQSWCACPCCRQRYREETGQELPLEPAWGSPKWRQFLDWRFASVGRLVRRLHAAARQQNPAAVVFSQYHFPLSTPQIGLRRRLGSLGGRIPPDYDDWYRPTFYAERLEDWDPDEDVLATETYRRSVQQPIWWVGAGTNHMVPYAGDRPVLVLTEYPQFPWSLTSLPAVELQVMIADVVANGGGPWFAMYGPGVGDPRGFDAIGEIYRQLAAAEPHLAGLQPAAPVALLHSRSTADDYGADQVTDQYLDEVLGWYKALMEQHLPCQILRDQDLTAAGLAGYRTLVLPNSARLTAGQQAAIAAFAAGGGGVVATYQAGQVEPGELETVLGIRRSGARQPIPLGYLRWEESAPLQSPAGPHILLPYRDDQVEVEPAGGRVTARVITAAGTFEPLPQGANWPPAVVCATPGRGRAVYFAGSVGRQYLRYHSPEVGATMAEAVRWAANGELPVDRVQAPGTVALQLRRQPGTGRTVLFLVNFSTTTGTSAPAVLPVTNVRFRWRGGSARTFSALTGRPLEAVPVSGGLEVRVPELQVLECVVLEEEGL